MTTAISAPAGDHVALLDGERGERAPDPGARDELMDRLDGRDDRLAVGDVGGMHDEALRGQGAGGGQEEKKERSRQAHHGVSGRRLTYMFVYAK